MRRDFALSKGCRDNHSLLVAWIPGYMARPGGIDRKQKAAHAPKNPCIHRVVVRQSQMSNAREKVYNPMSLLAEINRLTRQQRGSILWRRRSMDSAIVSRRED